MYYSKYLKQKIINLYSQKQKIGKHNVNENIDLAFLDCYFDNNRRIEENIYSISEILQYLIKDYESNLKLKNKIGLDFLNELRRSREMAHVFMKQNSLQEPQIILEQKQDLEEKYTILANQYGLKEFYYTLNPKLNPEENYNKAILLLNKTQLDLENLQKTLRIQESYKIGNGILSIQVNWQEESQNQGYYNYCSNTICLKDENSTFPLIHEYIHFVDKNTTCLLLTGKTSQQLYEEKIFTQKELFNNFDMSVFSKIKFNKEAFPWIRTLKLKSLFKDEILQNKYMQEVFKRFDNKKDYQQEFKDIIYAWIEEKQYSKENLLKEDINHILKNKITQFNVGNNIYMDEEKELIKKTLLFNKFNIKKNNIQNWSENLDEILNQYYYTTQKEMLARTIEQVIQGNLQQLSDRLTTPIISNNEKDKFVEIIKSWQNISLDIINIENKNNVLNRISNIRKKLEKEPQIISQLKLIS